MSQIFRSIMQTGFGAKTKIAYVGCGYVADFYLATLPNHRQLQLVGVYDRDPNRLNAFSSFHDVSPYDSFQALLNDESIEIIVNLTNPRSHYQVTKAALLHGKHVYSEKPLAWDIEEGRELEELAMHSNLYLASAPCSILGEAAQTAWKVARTQQLGPVRLVYAEMDDGLIHKLNYQSWRSKSGAPWPYRDEFETGCTLEHAAYYITWLVAMFGPAKTVTASASNLLDEKIPGVQLSRQAPDFTVGCIEFHSGVVARLTCSIIAAKNHSMQIFGDDAVLTIEDAWDYGSCLSISPRQMPSTPKPVPLARKFKSVHAHDPAHSMDFSRGIAELADAIQKQRPCRLSADFCLHVDEISHAIDSPQPNGGTYQLQSSCRSMAPMDWAE